MYDVGMSAKYLKSRLSKLNIFVNNEELCVDESGKGKLLLFDLIKNQVMINNEAYEISRLVKQVANGLVQGLILMLRNRLLSSLTESALNRLSIAGRRISNTN